MDDYSDSEDSDIEEEREESSSGKGGKLSCVKRVYYKEPEQVPLTNADVVRMANLPVVIENNLNRKKREEYDVEQFKLLDKYVFPKEEYELLASLKDKKVQFVEYKSLGYRFTAEPRGKTTGCATYMTMKKRIRALLAKKLYHDIDIVNSQPTIMLGLYKALGLKVPCLEEYVESREECLATFQEESGSRDDAKTAVISILNDGKMYPA